MGAERAGGKGESMPILVEEPQGLLLPVRCFQTGLRRNRGINFAVGGKIAS